MPSVPVRRLRRSRSDRVASGLCGGLGRYFGVDPVIFRVLLAVLVLFGGSGIVLYLLGWLAVPDEDELNPPIDRLVARLRRRGRWLPLSGLAVVAFVLWLILFSWWAPFSIFPVAAVVVGLGVLLSRRDRRYDQGAGHGPDPTGVDPAGHAFRDSSDPFVYAAATTQAGADVNYAGVNTAYPEANAAYDDANTTALSADYPPGHSPPYPPNYASGFSSARPTDDPYGYAANYSSGNGPSGEPPLQPAGVQLRSWFDETRTRSRERRQRSGPVRRVTIALLIASVAGLAVADAVTGIAFGVYFWVIGGIALSGLLLGLVLRRTPWIVAPLLVPAVIGIVTFGTSPASAHDGFGDRQIQPDSISTVPKDYRLGFGRTTLDLAQVPADTGTATGQPGRAVPTITIRQAAGQVRLVIPKALAIRVETHVHQGAVSVDDENRDDGWDVDSSYNSPAVAGDNVVLTIIVRLTAGQIAIEFV